jgi:hypothetical protein
MEELTQVLADKTVKDCLPQPDGSTVVFAEDCGPAPNAVEVFADHTDRRVEELSYHERDGQTAYEIGAGQ